MIQKKKLDSNLIAYQGAIFDVAIHSRTEPVIFNNLVIQCGREA
jgi:hypothetical protein